MDIKEIVEKYKELNRKLKVVQQQQEEIDELQMEINQLLEKNGIDLDVYFSKSERQYIFLWRD